MIGGRRPLPGRKLADWRVRVARPHSPYFRYTGPGQIVAKQAASMPLTKAGRLIFRRVVLVSTGLPGLPQWRRAYIVARQNLAPIFGLIAAAALLIDYVMTVAVSTASAIQGSAPHRGRERSLPARRREPLRPATAARHH